MPVEEAINHWPSAPLDMEANCSPCCFYVHSGVTRCSFTAWWTVSKCSIHDPRYPSNHQSFALQTSSLTTRPLASLCILLNLDSVPIRERRSILPEAYSEKLHGRLNVARSFAFCYGCLFRKLQIFLTSLL